MVFRLLRNFKTSVELFFACRAYRAKLPFQLCALYGQAKSYSPTQITMAIRKAGLSIEHRQSAYEMYLTKEQIRLFQEKSLQHRDNTPLPQVTLNKHIFS